MMKVYLYWCIGENGEEYNFMGTNRLFIGDTVKDENGTEYIIYDYAEEVMKCTECMIK